MARHGGARAGGRPLHTGSPYIYGGAGRYPARGPGGHGHAPTRSDRTAGLHPVPANPGPHVGGAATELRGNPHRRFPEHADHGQPGRSSKRLRPSHVRRRGERTAQQAQRQVRPPLLPIQQGIEPAGGRVGVDVRGYRHAARERDGPSTGGVGGCASFRARRDFGRRRQLGGDPRGVAVASPGRRHPRVHDRPRRRDPLSRRAGQSGGGAANGALGHTHPWSST